VGDESVAALVRGDRDLNLAKLGRALGGGPARMADAATIEAITGAPVGFAGPVGLHSIRIVADHELAGAADMVVGANANDAHRAGVVPGRDFLVNDWADIRVAAAGDRCPRPGCAGRYRDAHGIEVGHIFKLGAKYSAAMKAQVQTDEGVYRDLIMGCYGLGISRTMAAAIEAHHDDEGIVWPMSIAPFQVVLVLVNGRDETQRQAAEEIHDALVARDVDTLLDDRDERSGVKFKDADLIGYPVRVVVGRTAAEGNVEVALRRDKAARVVPISHAAELVCRLIDQEIDQE
jgi:prolyl-tRNA synthetase